MHRHFQQSADGVLPALTRGATFVEVAELALSTSRRPRYAFDCRFGLPKASKQCESTLIPSTHSAMTHALRAARTTTRQPFVLFFFSRLRHRRRSTLFPYTTLFR